jgi:tetratricopeptide (TPR) repeat protein
MGHAVFISYARSTSARDAQVLATKLGEAAFLDTEAIDDGDQFPPRLLTGLLDATVVVIFATKAYSERRFCRLEMRLALIAGDAAASHVVLALGEGASFVLDAMPPSIAGRSWPPADATSRLEEMVRRQLSLRAASLRSTYPEAEAERLVATFLEESSIPEPRSLGAKCSLPPGVGQSIGSRFVGRASELRAVHQILSGGKAARARLTAGGGFGKTRLATEYLCRYGPGYYPGGLFWVNAASRSLDDEFWRILKVLDDGIPNLQSMREQKRDVGQELERALRGVREPILYVVDNIPEAGPGEDALSIQDFCPAAGAVTVLATSRQDTREDGVRTIPIGALGRDPAILLLTENLPGASRLAWSDWGVVASWVGYLPLALDLLNRCLALSSVSTEDLLRRATGSAPAAPELDGLRDALRGQVPRDSVRGITEAFRISFEKLEERAQFAAILLAQLAPAPVPEALFQAFPEEWNGPAVRTALHSRHFVTSGSGPIFGIMHRLLADFLRMQAGDLASEFLDAACSVVGDFFTVDRCSDPLQWKVMNLFRPHAEVLLERVSLTGSTLSRATALCETAATVAFVQAEYPEYRRLWTRIVKILTQALGPQHPDTLWAMGGYARALRYLGDYSRARKVEEQVVETRSRALGEEHLDTLTAMSNLAETLTILGDYTGAQRLQEHVLEVRMRTLGQEHPDTLTALSNLAETLTRRGEYVQAQRLQERVLQLRMRLLGEENSETLSAMSDLAGILRRNGFNAEAQQLRRRVLEVGRRVWGEEHLDTLQALSDLAQFLKTTGDLVEAQRLGKQALELRRRVCGERHPLTLNSMEVLASILSEQGNHTEARHLRERVIEAGTLLLGEEHPRILEAMDNLADTLLALGEHDACRRLLQQILERRVRMLGIEHSDTLTSMSLLAVHLLTSGNRQEGLQLLRQCLAVRRKVFGNQHPDTTYIAELLLKFENEPELHRAPDDGV